MAEQADLNKAQAEAALAAFTDVVMKEVTGEEGVLSAVVHLLMYACLIAYRRLQGMPPVRGGFINKEAC